MHVFIFFLAWAVVSGSSAWSSSEVSCFSCGSECQKACGTRIFRACCFNFQRRRRSGASDYSNLKELDDSESTEEDGRSREPLPQLFRSLLRQGGDLFVSPSQLQDSWFLSSLYPSLDQRGDLRGEEDVNYEGANALLQSQGHADGRSLAPWDSDGGDDEEDAVSRRAEMGFRRLGKSALVRRQALRVRYPPPSQAKIRK